MVDVLIDDNGRLQVGDTVINTIMDFMTIKQTVISLSDEIVEYCDKRSIDSLHVIGIANACFPFMMNLISYMGALCSEYDIIDVKSYEGSERGKQTKIKYCSASSLEGKTVLVVDTMLDTGHTMNKVVSYIKKNMKAKHVLTCAMLKKQIPEEECVYKTVDFIGYSCLNLFLVGYGLDYNGKFRNIMGIYNYHDLKKIEDDKGILQMVFQCTIKNMLDDTNNNIDLFSGDDEEDIDDGYESEE